MTVFDRLVQSKRPKEFVESLVDFAGIQVHMHAPADQT